MGWLGRRMVRHTTPPEAPPPQPVRFGPEAILRESTGMLEPLRLAAWAPWLARAPRGNGQTVVLVPGYRAPDSVMLPLVWFLRSIGHDARTWGRGWNRGDVTRDVSEMEPVLRRWADDSGRPVAMVGWSLGGVISRELARGLPDVVDRVVSYGSPVVGGPTWTAAADFYGPEVCAVQADRARARDAEAPIQQPITTIFTRADHIVSWPACIDRTSPRVTHVEVKSNHLGLSMDPEVWWVVARALQPGA